MLLKQPKKATIVSKVLGGLIIFEALAFGGSYFIWNKLNKNREVRKKARDSAPWALDLYYKFGETLNSNNKAIRIEDERHWARIAETSKTTSG